MKQELAALRAGLRSEFDDFVGAAQRVEYAVEGAGVVGDIHQIDVAGEQHQFASHEFSWMGLLRLCRDRDRKSTRLNSSH